MKRLLLVTALLWSASAWAVEDPYDAYEYRHYCPENGPAYATEPYTTDSNGFVRCQCTSYVAEMLSDRMTARYYDNRAPNGLVKNFGNNFYYMPQDRRWANGTAVTRWSHAVYWRDSALYAGIGVTGARDNFTWDEARYNAVFPGDVAWWDAWDNAGGQYGHVAIVESAERDVSGRGVACVTLSDYNWKTHDFSRRRVCKTDGGNSFPDAFLHIDKDHAICTANPTRDNCQALWGGQMVASSGTKMDGFGGGAGGDSNPPSSSPPNLQIEEITVHIIPEDGDNTRLTEEQSLMNVGETYQVNVWPVSKEEHCQNGNTTGNEDFEVKADTFFKIAMSKGEGEWTLLKRSETHCKYMDEDNSKKEMIPITIPPGSEGKRLYLKSKVDAPGDIRETNEDDNWSDVEWYPIQGVCDLVISSGNLTKGRVTLNQGEPYGLGGTLLNLGPNACPSDTRLSYFYKKPGDTDWRYADGDDTPAFKLLPNQSTEEWMTTDTLVADIPGMYRGRICADTNNANQESNEGNNCFEFLYEVIAIVWKPDFIVASLWIAEGTTIKSGTRVHPHCIVKNIGNAKPTKDIRLAYYINSNQYRDDDNVEANEMCVGCEQHEQVNNDNIKLGDRGTRSYTCCVDYTGAAPELNEGNNCVTMYFTVVK